MKEMKGVLHRIAWVDLSTKRITIEEPEDELYAAFLGGYGLGAYYLYNRQKAGVDPLGQESIFGLLTGPLTGTHAITGNRFVAVGKSPKTNGWGDSNCGGTFGPALKQAGLDGIFFSGISDKPLYVVIENGQVAIKDAAPYWGLICSETEARLRQAHGPKSHAAVIGPAGERVSSLAAIINDQGRAAGRSGLGMAMGSKRLKAVVAIATNTVPMAEEAKLKELRSKLIKEKFNDTNMRYAFFHSTGTAGAIEPFVLKGDAPTKNWAGWKDHFSGARKIGAEESLKLKTKPYACWRCPIVCGAHVQVPSGPYAGEGHRPEYETLAAFGSMCLNDNLESICHLNNLCNDYGMDTISTGATIAFAIECFEHGVITKQDTNGIELTWGNHEAIVAIAGQIARGEGFGGTVLGDGIKKAVERLGEKSRPYAMECGGEELPMHDPRCFPGLGASYIVDATPGRHTQYGSWSVEGDMYPDDLNVPKIADKYRYAGKGEAHKYMSSFGHVINALGLCTFGARMTPAAVIPEYLALATGRKFTMEELLEIGERIANLRIAFNLREGIRNKDLYKLPLRVIGRPPLEGGATKGITVDHETEIRDYYVAMGWNPETGVPKRAVFERLGLHFALDVTEP